MPKDAGTKHFRKGTKSCTECRGRKLKCDGNTPCQNCGSHGRTCVLQTELARTNDVFKSTSRDRISNLEDEVGSLWAVVRELRAELGHKDETTPGRDLKSTFVGSRLTADTDAESIDSQEDTPGNAPTHLQQLFDGGVFDEHEPTSVSPHMEMGEVISPAALASATKKLRACMPLKHDVRLLAEYSTVWMSLYTDLFPTASLYKSKQELLASYESVQDPTAHPCAVAICLLSIAVTAQQAPAGVASQLTGIKDLQAFPREVSTVVEQIIVADNALGGTMEGIEATLLFLRLQLVRARIKKVWLLLRRIIALAELIGLPRAASIMQSLPNPEQATERQRAAAQLWSSICVTDRISGMMLNLPCGTAAYPFPKPDSIFSSEGKLLPNALFSALAGVAQQVLEIDNLHISGADDALIFQKVLSTDSDLRAISNVAPAEWWSISTAQLCVDHVLQYWHQYFTIRTHLATAMKSNQSDQYAYSRSVTIEASRSVALRYTQLRDKLPPGFFAGRILDLQALTATVFLLHSIYSQNGIEQARGDPENTRDLELVRKVTRQMQAVGKQLSGDVARQGSKALESMLDHFANPQAVGSKTLTLRVPMLGKVHINRKPVQQPHATPGMRIGATPAQSKQQAGTGNGSNNVPPYYIPQDQNGQYNAGTTDVDMANSMGWSMDLMGDFPFMADDPYSNGDSWLWFNDWTTPPQPQ